MQIANLAKKLCESSTNLFGINSSQGLCKLYSHFQQEGKHLLLGSRGPSTVTLIALW